METEIPEVTHAAFNAALDAGSGDYRLYALTPDHFLIRIVDPQTGVNCWPCVAAMDAMIGSAALQIAHGTTILVMRGAIADIFVVEDEIVQLHK